MSAADLALLEGAIRSFGEAVRVHSGGRLEIDGTTRIVEEPLDRLSGSGRARLAWIDATADRIAGEVHEGEVDSVFVFWKSGDVPVGAYWGGSGGAVANGAGYTSIAVLDRPDVAGRTYDQVVLHEWLHQV